MDHKFVIILLFSGVLFAGCNKPQLDLNYQPGVYDPISSNPVTDHQDEQKESNIAELIPFSDSVEDENPVPLIPVDLKWQVFSGTAPDSQEDNFEKIEDRRWTPIHFAYNQSFIGETERIKLEKLAEYLLEHPRYSLIIEGHCDERGSEEYNRVLGEKRAIAVQKYLEKLAINDQRITTISYGEDKPLQSGDSESIHSKNRRAEFIVGLQSH